MRKAVFGRGGAALLLAGLYALCLWAAGALRARAEDGVRLPILMYHSLVADPRRANDYILSPDAFARDLAWLSEHGYETVVVRDLIAYVTDGAPLPEKPVMITFDDGHLNTLTEALPRLQKHGMRCVVSVVGAYADAAEAEADPNPAYAYLTWADVRALSESGAAEVQSHSYALHGQAGRRGSLRRSGEALADYEQTLADDLARLNRLLEEHTGARPTAFAYPYGFVSPESREVLRQLGFQASFTCRERGNVLTRDPECLFGLNRYNRPSGVSTEAFMKKALAGT